MTYRIKDASNAETDAIIINWGIQNDVFHADNVVKKHKDKINTKSKAKDKKDKSKKVK